MEALEVRILARLGVADPYARGELTDAAHERKRTGRARA